jgi:hypothetical protein
VTIHSNAALATIRVNGRLYPVRSVPTCRTCQCKHRLAIEEGLVEGRAYKAILADLPDGHGLTERNVREHCVRDHLGVMDAAVRELQEQNATQRGEVVARGVEAVRGHHDFARSILGRVVDRLAKGELEPDIKDGLAAARLLAMLDGGTDWESERNQYVEAFLVYVHEVQEMLHPDQVQEWARRVSGYPIIRELEEQEARRWGLAGGQDAGLDTVDVRSIDA